ncbi:hypothetical protein [Paenisporosarcina indica]|uniref:hypothetical protein n=1 Tax=Paenisporosarcina indica TaxID=650093 RepID=UPI0009503336|nr:hypothetical protein [Paenisporosarcina indica]
MSDGLVVKMEGHVGITEGEVGIKRIHVGKNGIHVGISHKIESIASHPSQKRLQSKASSPI